MSLFYPDIQLYTHTYFSFIFMIDTIVIGYTIKLKESVQAEFILLFSITYINENKFALEFIYI